MPLPWPCAPIGSSSSGHFAHSAWTLADPTCSHLQPTCSPRSPTWSPGCTGSSSLTGHRRLLPGQSPAQAYCRPATTSTVECPKARNGHSGALFCVSRRCWVPASTWHLAAKRGSRTPSSYLQVVHVHACPPSHPQLGKRRPVHSCSFLPSASAPAASPGAILFAIHNPLVFFRPDFCARATLVDSFLSGTQLTIAPSVSRPSDLDCISSHRIGLD